MYFSRVRVATEGLAARDLRQLLQGNAYGNHQLLWKLFPSRNERPFLFRQELEPEALGLEEPRGLPMFYVVSDERPQDVSGLLKCECKPFTPQLRRGQRLAYRLRANPVVARRDEARRHSRHHDVLMDAKRTAKREGVEDRTTMREHMDAAAQQWLADSERSARGGYQLLAAPQVSGYRQHSCRRSGCDIRFSSVDYQGSLEVSDPDRFLRTLNQGIGRARAFGCGMWMVRRI